MKSSASDMVARVKNSQANGSKKKFIITKQEVANTMIAITTPFINHISPRARWATLLMIFVCSFAQAQMFQVVGSSTGTVGQASVAYTYSTDDPITTPTWVVTNGTVTSQTISGSRVLATAYITWTAAGTNTITFKDGSVVLASKNVTVTCGAASPTFSLEKSTDGVTFSAATASNCSSSALTFRISATVGSGGSAVRWYTTASGGTHFLQAIVYTPSAISPGSSATYYISSYSAACESDRVPITITVNNLPAAPTMTAGAVCGSGTVNLSGTPASGTTLRWFALPGDVSPVATGNSYSPSITQTTTFYGESYSSTTGCGSTRTPVVATSNTIPINPVDATDDFKFGGGAVELSVFATDPAVTVEWSAALSDASPVLGTGLSFTTPVITTTTSYYAKSTIVATGCKAASKTEIVATVIPVTPATAIRTEAVRVKDVKNDTQLDALTDTDRGTVYTYLDGLGRTQQQVIKKGSPLQNDIVQPVVYDNQGTASTTYLPYVSTTTDGSYQGAFATNQPAFFNNTSDKIADDTAPYSVTTREASPLARVKEQGTVGAAFQPGTTHTQRITYTFNDASEVRLLKSDGTSTAFYAVNTLSKLVSLNADNNQVIVFTDTHGRTILQKQQLDEVIDGTTVTYLETYYVYDEFDRVRYIISPKGVAALKAGSWSFTQAIKDNYTHQFIYDARGRMTEKKVPGQAWMYYAYDKFNRLVLSQDGLLRASNKWMFIKYDQKGRAMMQGLYLNASQTTRATIQTLIDGYYTTSHATYPFSARYEAKGATLHGYTNVSFPKTNADATAIEVLSVNYYDNYDFDFSGTDDYSYTNQGLTGESGQVQGRAYGMPTGSKRLILGTSTWLSAYVFYDPYGRMIQSKSNNHLSTAIDNVSTTVYDFEGRILVTKKYQNAGASNITTVVNKYEYDTQGRLLKINQTNNLDSEQTLSVYEYNELGQLVDKKLHLNAAATTNMQSVDYRYTIRGQLASINNAQLNVNTASNDETNDYFGMEFLYNAVDAGLGNTPSYVGNISAIKWKSPGAVAGTTDQKSYKYAYDKSNKLETATSQVYTGSAWTAEAGALNENLSYDHNGNIKTLVRNQRKHQLTGIVPSYISETIDNLTYSYNTAIGDQLLKVEDASGKTEGFANGANVATEYTYDTNGNTLTDQNKGISSIVYNFLGKPTQINFSDGRKLEYVYDAAGAKLTMKSYQGVTLLSTTDYSNGFVYENSALSFFGMPEGRVVKNGGTLEYQYAISDHQGNTRVVFTSVAPDNAAITATFEGNAADKASLFQNVDPAKIVSFAAANQTPSGVKVIRMNQTYNLAMTKSIKVFPGDKVDLEVYAYHENSSGYGTTSSTAGTVISLVATGFGGVSGGPGESGAIYNGVSSAVGAFGFGGNRGDTQPAAYLNYILFDKDYKVINFGWQPAPASAFSKTKVSFSQISVKETGYIFVYLSYDNASNNWVYFDDLKVTHTKTNVIQSNDYYPFGLQASTSWTRENAKDNNYLYNAANELNKVSGWYEMFYRGYDPALGRMLQVDPYATAYSNFSSYNYAMNNPVTLNDPTGGYVPLANNFGREMVDRAFENGWALDFQSVFGASQGGGTNMYSNSRSPIPSRRSDGITIEIDFDELENGSHTFNFQDGYLVDYDYLSDDEISDLGSAYLGIASSKMWKVTYDETRLVWANASRSIIFTTSAKAAKAGNGSFSPYSQANSPSSTGDGGTLLDDILDWLPGERYKGTEVLVSAGTNFQLGIKRFESITFNLQSQVLYRQEWTNRGNSLYLESHSDNQMLLHREFGFDFEGIGVAYKNLWMADRYGSGQIFSSDNHEVSGSLFFITGKVSWGTDGLSIFYGLSIGAGVGVGGIGGSAETWHGNLIKF